MRNSSVIRSTYNLVKSSNYNTNVCRDILRGQTVSVLGYGPQGMAQSKNLRDLNIPVNLGLRKDGESWKKATNDGWMPGHNLFEIDEACNRGTIIKFLLSDSAQKSNWNTVKSNLNSNDTLYFSHGFGVHFNKYTNIIPPEDVNVILVAPKCSGNTVRKHFLESKGINSSYAVYQDVNNAQEICLALGFLMGNNYLFETTFEKEVHSDLTGERCVLMGLIQGAFLAQYEVLRENGHSPSEAYNETIEEALESLYPLVSEKGMDWMYSNCSTTAQRGALDWAPRFKNVLKPVINDCYEKVVSGEEAKISISSNSKDDYRNQLNKELDEINNQEMWLAGRELRALRPENNQ